MTEVNVWCIFNWRVLPLVYQGVGYLLLSLWLHPGVELDVFPLESKKRICTYLSVLTSFLTVITPNILNQIQWKYPNLNHDICLTSSLRLPISCHVRRISLKTDFRCDYHRNPYLAILTSSIPMISYCLFIYPSYVKKYINRVTLTV